MTGILGYEDFPNFRGTFVGVPVIRAIAFAELYWESAPIMENQMENSMETAMEAIISGFFTRSG